MTGTLAGQIVMEGHLRLRITPWLRRLITRLIALVPAVVVIALAGEGSTQSMLILSQVVLSLQLSFAVIPLIHFTFQPAEHGGVCNSVVGPNCGLDHGCDHRRPQWQAGSGPDRRMGRADDGVDVAPWSDPRERAW